MIMIEHGSPNPGESDNLMRREGGKETQNGPVGVDPTNHAICRCVPKSHAERQCRWSVLALDHETDGDGNAGAEEI